MPRVRFPSLEVALLGAIVVVGTYFWQDYSPKAWDHKAALFHLGLLSGWSLIVIGWIGRVGNILLERIEDALELAARRKRDSRDPE